MIDKPNRKDARFPPKMEDAAARNIAEALSTLKPSLGIASGSRGGDILFHEACLACGVPSDLVLPFEPKSFETQSVAGVESGNWMGRFRAIVERSRKSGRLFVLELQSTDDPYGACNLAMLARARAIDPSLHLLALWSGLGDGAEGGTSAMIEAVRAKGGKVHTIGLSC